VKVDVHYLQYAKEVLSALTQPGLLLVTQGKSGKPNAMTIGWATMGCLWSEPCFVTLVRPARYSYGLLEENGEFTINVLPKDMAEVAGYCGTASGRDEDKFANAGLTAVPGKHISVPIIGECVIHYECKVVHFNDTNSVTMPEALAKMAYPGGDGHRLYYGQIVATYADDDAIRRL
jgi:flavin reductase (DIM6/NTAB) family NADH-FMN oxidoreductase RutF